MGLRILFNSANLDTDCDHARADFGVFLSFFVDNPIQISQSVNPQWKGRLRFCPPKQDPNPHQSKMIKMVMQHIIQFKNIQIPSISYNNNIRYIRYNMIQNGDTSDTTRYLWISNGWPGRSCRAPAIGRTNTDTGATRSGGGKPRTIGTAGWILTTNNWLVGGDWNMCYFFIYWE